MELTSREREIPASTEQHLSEEPPTSPGSRTTVRSSFVSYASYGTYAAW